MIGRFDPDRKPILVDGFVTGRRRTVRVRFAIDTGATRTMIGTASLAAAGVDLSAPAGRGRMTAATGRATAPIFRLDQLTALGQAKSDFRVVAHDLPLGVTYEGLLGLDFFRGSILTLDFARGRIALRPPRRWWRFGW